LLTTEAAASLQVIRPAGTVVPGGLIFCCGFFMALCGAISPRCLGRSPRNFHIWLEVWALRHCRSQIWGPPLKTIFGGNWFRGKIS